jgi:hypothetical protein
LVTKRTSAPEAITDEVVAVFGRSIGLHYDPDRLSLIAQRLREMYQVAADLDDLDVTGYEPAVRFDPTWPERVR